MKKNYKFKSAHFIINAIVSALLLFVLIVWAVIKIEYSNQSFIYGGKNVDTSVSSGTVRYTEADNTHPMQIWKEDANGNKLNNFKIMSTSDTHLYSNSGTFCVDVLEQHIKQEHPDLVVLCGDNVYGPKARDLDKLTFKRLIDMFETNNQYWTFVLGNHDGQGFEKDGHSLWESRKMIFNVERGLTPEGEGTIASHCLARSGMIDEQHPEQYGFGTNHIEILGSQNKTLSSLIFTDCDSLTTNDCQIDEWFDQAFENRNEPIILFNHIPFEQIQTAWDLRNTDKSNLIWGIQKETICVDGTKSKSLFDELHNYGLLTNTKPLCVFGHDHINNINLEYEGVQMMYSLGLQYNSYNSRNSSSNWLKTFVNAIDGNASCYIDGASEYIIKNNEISIANRYNQFTGVLDPILNSPNNQLNVFTYNTKGINIASKILLPLFATGNITYYGLFIANNVSKRKKIKRS